MNFCRTIYLPFLILIACIPGLPVYGQYFDTGQDPSGLRWKKITSDHFRVIFPADFEKEAIRFTELLETSLPAIAGDSKGLFQHRFPVIIHNHSAVSNGMVNWAPRRMEIFPLPPQSNYPQDWLEQLAIHELRHAVQLENLNTGSSRWMKYLLGEQFTSLITGLYIPSWYLEGDAVIAETAFSHSGRGRVPNFEMELRAQFLEDKVFSYDKAVFGSYKHYIPDRYILGYYLTSTGRKLYGKELWDHVTRAVSRNPFLPNPFHRGIKHFTGLSQSKLYERSMLHLDSLWKEQDNSIHKTAFKKIIVKENSNWADYHYPAYMENGAVFALKNSIDDVPRFVRIDSAGNSRILFTPGDLNEDALTYADKKIYWAEYQPDIRWENRNWCVIKIYNTQTKKLRQLGNKTHWFAPAPSPDGKKVAVVEVLPDNQVSLVIVEEESSKILQKINTPENYLFMTPAWEDNGDRLITIIQGTQGKAIAEVTLKDGRTKMLSPFTHVEISGPVYHQDKILFLGGYNGIDNVYTLDTVSGEILMLTSSKLGAHDAGLSDDGSKILYVDYTAHGHQIVESKVEECLMAPIRQIKRTSPRLDSIISVQEGAPIQFRTGNIPYRSTKYNKTLHLINFHSWAPAYLDIGNIGLYPGITLMSQNLLSTTFVTLGYQWNRFEQTGKYHADITYKGLFPVFGLSYSNGLRGGSYQIHPDGPDIRYTYGEEEISGTVGIPLNLTRGKFYRGLSPVAGTTQIIRKKTASSPSNLILYNVRSLDFGLTFYNIIKSSDKDLGPTWGQIVRMQQRAHFPGIKDSATLQAITVELYFPGLWRHHSFKITGGYQKNTGSKYYAFADFIPFPRGFDQETGKKSTVVSLDYSLPLFYPDLSIPRLLYLKRISGNFFADYAQMKDDTEFSLFHSLGFDLITDCHLFRFYAPLNLGLRTIYTPKTQETHFEFVFSVSLSSY